MNTLGERLTEEEADINCDKFLIYDQYSNLIIVQGNETVILDFINIDNTSIIYGKGVSIENKQINILKYSPPSKITTIYESTSSYSQSCVTFNWKALYDNGCNEIANNKIKKYDSSSGSYIYIDPNNISSGNKYQYKIMAINVIVDGKEIDVLSIIILSTEPLNLDIITYNDENIKISWDVFSDTGTNDNTYSIKSYYLEYKDSSLSNNEYIEIYSGTGNSFLFKIITNKFIYCHTYYFKILCSTQRGNSTSFSEKKYLYSTTPFKA